MKFPIAKTAFGALVTLTAGVVAYAAEMTNQDPFECLLTNTCGTEQGGGDTTLDPNEPILPDIDISNVAIPNKDKLDAFLDKVRLAKNKMDNDAKYLEYLENVIRKVTTLKEKYAKKGKIPVMIRYLSEKLEIVRTELDERVTEDTFFCELNDNCIDSGSGIVTVTDGINPPKQDKGFTLVGKAYTEFYRSLFGPSDKLQVLVTYYKGGTVGSITGIPLKTERYSIKNGAYLVQVSDLSKVDSFRLEVIDPDQPWARFRIGWPTSFAYRSYDADGFLTKTVKDSGFITLGSDTYVIDKTAVQTGSVYEFESLILRKGVISMNYPYDTRAVTNRDIRDTLSKTISGTGEVCSNEPILVGFHTVTTGDSTEKFEYCLTKTGENGCSFKPLPTNRGFFNLTKDNMQTLGWWAKDWIKVEGMVPGNYEVFIRKKMVSTKLWTLRIKDCGTFVPPKCPTGYSYHSTIGGGGCVKKTKVELNCEKDTEVGKLYRSFWKCYDKPGYAYWNKTPSDWNARKKRFEEWLVAQCGKPLLYPNGTFDPVACYSRDLCGKWAEYVPESSYCKIRLPITDV